MIWEDCQGNQKIRKLSGILYRLIENQEQIATLGYVDTLEEQALLEEMLDAVKPAYPETSDEYHYLLKTPFRYPPLKRGSRFGRIHEPSIFYGGRDVGATLAESAYYRFVFWYSMDGRPVKDKMRSEHTVFSAAYRTEKGVQLQSKAFEKYQKDLTHPASYNSCQLLGTAMRKTGIQVFEYASARDPAKGVCIGLFSIEAFSKKKPLDAVQWLCELSALEVSFKQLESRQITTFGIDNFLVDGKLPLPV